MAKRKMREEIKAGLLIFLSLLILSVFIVLIGGGQLFEKFDTYTVKVMNAAGLEVGSQVKLGGVRVGRVTSITEPAGHGEPVTIEIGIRQGTTLYQGTRALITQIGFVGDLYLLLAIDDTVNERIPPGSEIPAEESVALGVIIAKLEGIAGSIDKLIADIDRVFSDKNVKGVEDLIGNLNKAVVDTSANVDSLAKSLQRSAQDLETVLADFERVLGKVETVLVEVEGLVTDNRGEITELIKRAREDFEKAGTMLASIEETSRTVDGAVALQSQNLDMLLYTLTRTTEDLQEVLIELKSKPWSLLYKESKED